jgi:polyhydroxyalkanoate synthesis regulator phasin
MEISGEIHYANVDIDFDVDYLAETLATNHDFVDSTVLHAHVEEYCDSYVADSVSERVQEATQELRTNMESMAEEFDQYEFRVRMDDIDGDIDELRHQVKELQPNNNYVRINDLHKIIEEVVRAEICVAFAAGHHKMQDRLNGTDIGIKEG